MLKIDANKGEQHLEIAGSTVEVLTELGLAIATIYNQLKTVSPGTAETFRKHLAISIIDPASPIWDCDIPDDPNGHVIVTQK